MVNDDKFILLLDKIAEIRESTVRMEADQQNMKEDLEEVKRQDVVQNKLLAEHIQGVQTAQSRLDLEVEIRKELSARVAKLEIPRTFIANIYKVIMYSGGVIGVIYEAGRILHKW